MEEKEDIDKQRFNLFKSLSWQDKYNNKYHRVRTHRETIPLNNVSVWAGDYTAGTYYARLDHAISRRMLGACHGATKRTKILPHPSCDHRILEYGCAVVTLNDPLVIEMVRESTIPNKTMLYVDGRIEAEIVSHAPHLLY